MRRETGNGAANHSNPLARGLELVCGRQFAATVRDKETASFRLIYSWGVAKLHYSTAARFWIILQPVGDLGDGHELGHSA